MDHPTSDARPSIGFYMLVLIAAMVGLAILFGALQMLFSIDTPTGVSSVLPTLAAAMITGDRYARAQNAMPSKPVAWRFAWLATGLTLILTFVILLGLIALDPELQAAFSQAAAPMVLLILLVVISVIILLLNRFFLTQGAKAQLVQQAKRKG